MCILTFIHERILNCWLGIVDIYNYIYKTNITVLPVAQYHLNISHCTFIKSEFSNGLLVYNNNIVNLNL